MFSRIRISLLILLFGSAGTGHAQYVARPLPTWRAELPAESEVGGQLFSRGDSTGTRSHTVTGLLIGGAAGVVAATVFLIGFCDDPDTKCEADEVGRAFAIFALPPALVGALIGSLIRS